MWDRKSRGSMKRYWWLNLVRGVVALIIGILIFAWPNVAGSMLVNFMGIYWLVSGLMSLRWGLSTHRAKRLWFAAGIIGTVGGVLILLRSLYGRFIDPGLMITLFGVVALITGLMHLFGGFRTADMIREQSWGSVLLGIMEVILGILLIFSTSIGPFTKIAAGSWAFIGGISLVLQSLQTRRTTLLKTERPQRV
jgi:uncharacterized membrane protein HdeD (DUF308 family)